ncbi:MAG: plasmid pRiA4b ORF-3 family protein [Prevotellaceae bacterium]|jgi:hypothetical protein|nr:plasmid pRiA4b ORF-3 family protein [Prevotellaceae bacterium]
MAIYKYKLTIEGNKNFVRECEIEDDSTLYDLHRYIQKELDFDDAQLAVFFISNQRWERILSIPVFDLGNGSMDSVVIGDLVNNERNNLLYVFDIYNSRQLQIEFMYEAEETPRATYPRTVAGKGNPPNQFSENTYDAEIENDEDDISSFENDELDMLSETDDV